MKVFNLYHYFSYIFMDIILTLREHQLTQLLIPLFAFYIEVLGNALQCFVMVDIIYNHPI